MIHPSGNRILMIEEMRAVVGTALQVAVESGEVAIPLEPQYEHALNSRILITAE